MRSVVAALCFSALLAGCKTSPPEDVPELSGRGAELSAMTRRTADRAEAAPPTEPQITPVSGTSGRIASVNEKLRFVVIDFLFSALPPIDQRMNVYRDGKKVGEVRITGPSENLNIAADLVQGEARVGDEVRVD